MIRRVGRTFADDLLAAGDFFAEAVLAGFLAGACATARRRMGAAIERSASSRAATAKPPQARPRPEAAVATAPS